MTMLPALAQITDALPASPPAPGMPWYGYALVTLLGAGGFWGWAKLYTTKRFDQVSRMWDHITTQERQIGELKATVSQLQTSEAALKHRLAGLVAGYKDLARTSLAEINKLRRQLSLPALDRWPPPRPATPASPAATKPDHGG